MDIPASVFRYELKSYYKTEFIGDITRTDGFSAPYIYEPGSHFAETGMYVLYSNALPSVVPAGNLFLICIGKSVPAAWKHSCHRLLLLYTSDALWEVFNRVQKIVKTYQEWSNSLYMELNHDRTFRIEQFTSVGVSLLKRPFYVMDAALRIVFSSTDKTLEDGSQVFEAAGESFLLGFKCNKSIKQSADMERNIRVPYFSQQTFNDCRIYCYNIFAMKHFACCCFFFEDQQNPFDERDLFLADFFFNLFRRAYLKYIRSASNNPSPGNHALYHLLTHHPLSNEEYAQLVLEDKESWQLFRLKGKQGSRVLPPDVMCSMLNLIAPEQIICTIVNNVPVGLIRNNGNDKEKNEIVMNCFHELLLEMGYIAAISNSFREWKQLDIYYQQTSFLVEHCIDGSSRTEYQFEDYSLENLLHTIASNIPEESLYTSGFLSLLEYDQRKNTALVKTLRNYLRSECNISRTAQELFLHRTSLMKRLERAEQLLGHSLDDADYRLYLRICLRVLEKNQEYQQQNS